LLTYYGRPWTAIKGSASTKATIRSHTWLHLRDRPANTAPDRRTKARTDPATVQPAHPRTRIGCPITTPQGRTAGITWFLKKGW